MRKEYVKPNLVVEEFISEIYMQPASVGAGGSVIEPDKPVIPGEANDRRGGWGNLWD